MRIKIEIEGIANGFLVSFYDGDSTSRGSFTMYCDTWRAVNAAINKWKTSFAKWLDDYDPTGYNPAVKRR